MNNKSPVALHILPGRLIGGNVVPSRTGGQASRPYIVIFFLVQHLLADLALRSSAPIPLLGRLALGLL